ncbi:MAG: leucine-rich repeat protein [Bacteroidaceae bacterium]|nr:leucine-rich repeat protein [Bacteroidaceae bacterium]
MKTKLLSLFVALVATTALWASNIITYTATEKLPETVSEYDGGLHTDSFNVKVSSHTFSNGVGTITFAGEVTIIGERAFDGCYDMTSITIPNSVTKIGKYAFMNCWSMTSIDMSDNVTEIDEETFYNCSALRSIIIPSSTTKIGVQAFFNCQSLTSVNIPSSVTTIEEMAFYGCNGLTSIQVESTNTHYCSIDNVLFTHSQDTLMLYPIGNNRTEYCIPVSVTVIGNYAFAQCASLKSIIIPNSVTIIEEMALYSCTGLTSVTIPNSVTTIGEWAFYECNGWTKTNYTGTIADWCKIKFSNYSSNPIYYSHNLFINDVEVKDLVIPEGVDTIGNYAFYYCSGLTSITIPNSVTTIGEEAFFYCSGLTSITIPNSVTTIGGGAFSRCSNLTSVTIPNSVTTIGNYAFYDCRSLTSITCEANTPPTCGSWCFADVDKSIPVYVPAQSISAYKQATGWKDFTNIQGFCDGEPYFNVQDTTICGQPYTFVWEGDSVRYGGEIKHGSSWNGEYREWWDWRDRTDTTTRNYISVGGCDSTLQLVVHYPHFQYAIIRDTIEEGESFWSKYTETGIYYERVTNVRGCDSIVSEIHLFVQPKPTYVVTLSVNNTKYGSVEGGGTYNKGDTVSLVATPNKGYQFNQWSDGVTTNPRTIYNIDKDYALTAQFGIKQCSWLVESNDLEMGAVSTTFTNEYYNYGTQITVEASANSGYKFVKWNDGKKYNPYKFSLLEDKYLLAIFMAEEEEMDTTQVQPSDTTATFTWPFIIGGFTYTLTIYLDAACTIPFCTLTFNQYGQLIGITFGAHAPRRSAMANQEEGFTTTINGLSAGTEYFFKMETKDEEGKLINTDEGGFITKNSGVVTNINRVLNNSIHNSKFIMDGHLYILRDGNLYTATGARVK